MGKIQSKTEVRGKRVRGMARIARAGQGACVVSCCEGDSKPAHAKTCVCGTQFSAPACRPPLTMEPHWSPTLNETLRRIVDPNRGLLSNNQVAKAMKKTLQDEQDLFALNLYTHNPAYHPSEPRLRLSWKNFDAFLRLVGA